MKIDGKNDRYKDRKEDRQKGRKGGKNEGEQLSVQQFITTRKERHAYPHVSGHIAYNIIDNTNNEKEYRTSKEFYVEHNIA